MTVDIRGTNTINKGAQLMLEAAAARLRDRYEVSVPIAGTSYDVRSLNGLRQTLHRYGHPRASAALGSVVPRRVRRQFGLVADSDITGVVDASGFAYSDSFGAARARREALFGRAWAKRGVPKVLLPQAFGPFEDPEVRTWCREVVAQAQLVFARDRVSLDYLRSLGTSTPIDLAPDFTIGVGPASVRRPLDEDYVAIVPNGKMVKAGVFSREAYVDELGRYAAAAQAAGLRPLIVVHETGDSRIAQSVAEASGSALFTDPDPRVLKGVIAESVATVASRFHAIVGALSQGVPTVALGWSHKYRELLADFEVEDWLTAPGSRPDQVLAAVLGDAAGRARLAGSKQRLLQDVDGMWSKTFDTLDRIPRGK